MNKAGENSHPNGIAFLIGTIINYYLFNYLINWGKLITGMDRGIFGMEKEMADWNDTYACSRYFDNDPFILKEFTKVRYINK